MSDIAAAFTAAGVAYAVELSIVQPLDVVETRLHLVACDGYARHFQHCEAFMQRRGSEGSGVATGLASRS